MRARREPKAPPFDRRYQIGARGGGSFGGFSADSPDFYAPFADAGSGAANLALTYGSGSATFTRTSAASTVLSTGLIGDVASGTARSRYDPSTLTYQGLFTEAADTNVCLQSEDFLTTWAAIGTPTNTPGAATCGTVSLSLIGDESAIVVEGYSQTITFTGDAVKSVSFFFKQGTSTSTAFQLVDTTAVADRLLGAITWSGATPSITMTTGTLLQIAGPFGSSGVYRAEVLTTSVTATNTNSLRMYPATDAALAVLATGNIYTGGVQAQNKTNVCGSYVKTTTVAVTRNIDALSYTSANIKSIIGTAYAEISTSVTQTSPGGLTTYIDGGNVDDGGRLIRINGEALTSITIDDGPTRVVKSGLTSILNTPRKRASAWGETTMSITGDGAAVSSGAFDGAMTSTSLRIGCSGTSTCGSSCMKEVKIWFSKATNAQLVTLTT